MDKPKSDKISILFAVALFVGASLISLKYIGDISADIENGAAISPFKLTDFSIIDDFSKSSWMAFSNLGDETPPITDGRLEIINQDTKYQSMLAQPLMMSVNKKYKIDIQYEIKPVGDFSVKYGLVSDNIIGKPIFSSDLDANKTEIEFEYISKVPTPLSFQYFRSLGSGEFDLQSIKIEEVSDDQTVLPSPTPIASATLDVTTTPTATPAQTVTTVTGEPLGKYSVNPGWNPFGYNQSVSSASFTSVGLSVYKTGPDGWVIAKPNDKGSNFAIAKGSAVYISNETGQTLEVSLSPADLETPVELIRGWNILFSQDSTDSSELKARLNGEEKSLSDLIGGNKASKYIYSVNPAKPNDLIKINLEKYPKVGAGQVLWIYLF